MRTNIHFIFVLKVEITAALIDRLIHSVSSNTEVYIVDAGDGKGYLSSRLALQYKHRVLGIDFQELNTENALQRNRKLEVFHFTHKTSQQL